MVIKIFIDSTLDITRLPTLHTYYTLSNCDTIMSHTAHNSNKVTHGYTVKYTVVTHVVQSTKLNHYRNRQYRHNIGVLETASGIKVLLTSLAVLSGDNHHSPITTVTFTLHLITLRGTTFTFQFTIRKTTFCNYPLYELSRVNISWIWLFTHLPFNQRPLHFRFG